MLCSHLFSLHQELLLLRREERLQLVVRLSYLEYFLLLLVALGL